MPMPKSIHMIENASAAACLLQHPRGIILEHLRQPGSASSVARQIGISRQKVAYHLRQLQQHGLLEAVEERRVGNCVEQIVQAKAQHFLISNTVLGRLNATQADLADRFSSAYQVALASRIAEDVNALRQGAAQAGQKLATLSIQTEIAFESPKAQADFTQAINATLLKLIDQYHHPEKPSSRNFAVNLLLHPAVDQSEGT